MLSFNSIIKKIFFKNATIKTFYISRLYPSQIQEKVFLQSKERQIEVSDTHGMICLDPFCMAVWLSNENVSDIHIEKARIVFKRNNKVNAAIDVGLIESIPTDNGQLLLYKIKSVKNNQFTALHRLTLLAYLLKSKSNTYYSRRVVSALYSYPRNIIIVSYRDSEYCNIFPMDIHCYLKAEGIYILGLRTTNVTLDKILDAKKVVVCDTDTVDIETVYALGKHSSKSPTNLADMPFALNQSEVFNFPVPDFTGLYAEVEIIHHKKMGYHMLLMGKVVNHVKVKNNPAPLYHISFLQYQESGYNSIEGVF